SPLCSPPSPILPSLRSSLPHYRSQAPSECRHRCHRRQRRRRCYHRAGYLRPPPPERHLLPQIRCPRRHHPDPRNSKNHNCCPLGHHQNHPPSAIQKNHPHHRHGPVSDQRRMTDPYGSRCRRHRRPLFAGGRAPPSTTRSRPGSPAAALGNGRPRARRP
ncbi:unnamed protein product, partial [Ectocarpus sp. 12 AP-2014]